MEGECTYCGSDVAAHDPLVVGDADGTVGQFCNYACLSAHIESEELVVGDACEWSPDADCR
ncbi:hypothetical protein ACFQMA_09965 [Halosimplex aquaticum]|uniref:MYM-type domain-containing protein n=1 Tax=Halosimplex aquaticum TaxID=3026162 RepID=A0ABD5Y378_9EURY|nr:hypothetical protein [Halosimplex aquaticum]